jgi:DnaJ-class molecular chaperone
LRRIKDHYATLGVEPRSHARVIEETYWERAHELHGVPTRQAQRRLKVLNEAYETLASPHKRAAYDRKRREFENEVAASQRGPGFFQMFVNLLGKPFRPD